MGIENINLLKCKKFKEDGTNLTEHKGCIPFNKRKEALDKLVENVELVEQLHSGDWAKRQPEKDDGKSIAGKTKMHEGFIILRHYMGKIRWNVLSRKK